MDFFPKIRGFIDTFKTNIAPDASILAEKIPLSVTSAIPTYKLSATSLSSLCNKVTVSTSLSAPSLTFRPVFEKSKVTYTEKKEMQEVKNLRELMVECIKEGKQIVSLDITIRNTADTIVILQREQGRGGYLDYKLVCREGQTTHIYTFYSKVLIRSEPSCANWLIFLALKAYQTALRDMFSPVPTQGNSMRHFLEGHLMQMHVVTELSAEDTDFTIEMSHCGKRERGTFALPIHIDSLPKFSIEAPTYFFEGFLKELKSLYSEQDILLQARSFLQAIYRRGGERDLGAEARAVIGFFKPFTLEKEYATTHLEDTYWDNFLSSLDSLETATASWPAHPLLPDHCEEVEFAYRICCSAPHLPLTILQSALEIKALEIEHMRLEPAEKGPLLSDYLRKKITHSCIKNPAGDLAHHVRNSQELGIITPSEMEQLQEQIPFLEDAMACFNRALLNPKTLLATQDAKMGSDTKTLRLGWTVSKGQKQYSIYQGEERISREKAVDLMEGFASEKKYDE